MVRALILIGLLALTAWQGTRSRALNEARDAEARERHTPAVGRALDHLDQRPWSREAARIAARGLSQLDFPRLAEPYYQRAGTLEHDDQHIRAFGLVRGNHREEAIASYREILAEHPDDILALRRLAGLLLSETRLEEAREVARWLLEIPEGVVIGYTLAGISYQMGLDPDPARAASALERALELDPNHDAIPLPEPIFWTYLVDALIKDGQADRALAYLDRAQSRLGEEVGLLLLRGEAHYQKGDIEEAARAWRRVVALESRNAQGWLNLGRLALQRNEPAEAIEHLERASALTPSAFEPVYHLALAHRRLGHDEQALRFEQRADQLRRGLPPTGMNHRPEGIAQPDPDPDPDPDRVKSEAEALP